MLRATSGPAAASTGAPPFDVAEAKLSRYVAISSRRHSRSVRTKVAISLKRLAPIHANVSGAVEAAIQTGGGGCCVGRGSEVAAGNVQNGRLIDPSSSLQTRTAVSTAA